MSADLHANGQLVHSMQRDAVLHCAQRSLQLAMLSFQGCVVSFDSLAWICQLDYSESSKYICRRLI